MSKPVAVLAPLSEHRGPRIVAVMHALERRGMSVVTLASALPAPWREPRRHMPDNVVRAALSHVSSVVVLPRDDASIGAGTLRDLRLAQRLGVPVRVVLAGGRLVDLADADLRELPGDDRKLAARVRAYRRRAEAAAAGTDRAGAAPRPTRGPSGGSWPHRGPRTRAIPAGDRAVVIPSTGSDAVVGHLDRLC